MGDIGRAFTFPFKDPQWFVKFLIGCLMCMLAVVGIGFFILAGYFIQITQRAMRNEERALPDWGGIGQKLVLGIKIVIVYLVYLLPVMLLMIPLFPLAVLTDHPEAGDLVGLFSLVYFFGFVLIIVLAAGIIPRVVHLGSYELNSVLFFILSGLMMSWSFIYTFISATRHGWLWWRAALIELCTVFIAVWGLGLYRFAGSS